MFFFSGIVFFFNLLLEKIEKEVAKLQGCMCSFFLECFFFKPRSILAVQ